MTPDNLEIVAFSHNADLDQLGAARCILLANTNASLMHPVRLKQNAWEFARKQNWFETINIKEIDFKKVNKVHLIGVSLPKHNPELSNKLVRHNIETIIYANRRCKLPFKFFTLSTRSQSITAGLLNRLLKDKKEFNHEDLDLFAMAICEKTWAGLSSRVTPTDLIILDFLRKKRVSNRRIADSIVLGLREGQTRLYHEMLRNIQDIHPGNWPVTLICVNSAGKVQDLEPIVESIWSEICPHIAVICITSGKFSRVWARSSISEVDLAEVFKDFRPDLKRNWVSFNFSGTNHKLNSYVLKDYLFRFLPPALTAEKIMSVSPQSIDCIASVKKAMDAMLKFNLMSLVVTRQGKYAGIITRRDLDRAVQMELLDSPIEPYVPTSTPVVGPTTPARALKNIMVRFNLTRLPVVQENEAIGIITTRELLRALPDHLPLPPDYLPLAEVAKLPSANKIEEIIKRVFSLKVFHILSKIGKFATRDQINAFAVGGFVRDLLMEKQNLDIDIVVIGDAIPFARRMSKEFNCDFKVFDRFHTARIYLEDMKIDFSSARIEHYPDPGALPQIEFSGLSSDLYRRDFTINSLALSLNSVTFLELKDFFGGFADLAQKKIRILHSFSFIEDPTRLFRAIRFARRFNFNFEKDTRRAFDLAVHRGCMRKLSIKRIGSEISRCLNEEKPYKIIEELFNNDLMTALSPELNDISMIPSRFRLVKGLVKRFKVIEEEIDEEAILWTGLLCTLSPQKAANILDSIGTPHSRRVLVVSALKAVNQVPEKISAVDIDNNSNLFNLLSPYPIEALIALMAFALEKRNSRKVLKFIGELRTIKPLINGHDLISAGIPPGPHMRTIFKHILELKLQGKKLSKNKELEIAIQKYKILSS
ncbi:MAG: CBS domain-containing protein [Candidatus Rifleibacteriota bacterium]